MNINSKFSLCYQGTQAMTIYTGGMAKENKIVKYKVQTTNEQENKGMQKLSKEEALAAMQEVCASYGEDVLVEFSTEGMAAFVEHKKGILDTIEPKQDLEAKNAAFQKEIVSLDRSANHLPEYCGIYEVDKTIAAAVENCSKEEQAFVYHIIRQNFLISNKNGMTEEERQANISLGMKKAEYAAEHWIPTEQKASFFDAMESVAKLASAGKADKDGTMDYGVNKKNYLGQGSHLVATNDPLDIMKKMDTNAYAEYQKINSDSNNENRALDALKYVIKWYAGAVEKNPKMVEQYQKKSEQYSKEIMKTQNIDTTFAELDVTSKTSFLESLRNFQVKRPNFLNNIIQAEFLNFSLVK